MTQHKINGLPALLGIALLINACASTQPYQSGIDFSSGSNNSKVDGLWVPEDNAQSEAGDSQNNEFRYAVKSGDTLRTITSKLTGSADNWQSIADHNSLTNPNTLSVGQVLRVPKSMLDELTLSSTTGDDYLPDVATARFDLIDSLKNAQQYDADFKIALTNFDIAQQNIALSRSSLLPQATASYQLGYYDFTNDRSDQYDKQQLSLSLSQSLYDRPQIIALSQARRNQSVADLQLKSDHEVLVLSVADAYFSVLKSASEVRFRRADIDATSRQLLQSRRSYEVGSTAITDVVEAQAQYDLAIASEIVAKNNMSAAKEQWAVTTGLSANSSLSPLDDNFVPVSPEPYDVDSWERSADLNNIRLLVERQQAIIAQQEVDRIRAGRHPTVDLTGTLSSTDTANDIGTDTDGGNVILGISLPLLTGGRISAQIAQEVSRARLANDQVLNIQRQIIQSTRDAYRGAVAGVSRVAALRQALTSTRKAAEATRAGFNAGTRTSVELLNSERETFRAVADYESAQYDYIVSLLTLKQSAGIMELADIERVNQWLQRK